MSKMILPAYKRITEHQRKRGEGEKKRLTREGQRHPRGTSVLGHKSSSYSVLLICFKEQFCLFSDHVPGCLRTILPVFSFLSSRLVPTKVPGHWRRSWDQFFMPHDVHLLCIMLPVNSLWLLKPFENLQYNHKTPLQDCHTCAWSISGQEHSAPQSRWKGTSGPLICCWMTT